MTYIILILNIATATVTSIPTEFRTLQACTFASNAINDATQGNQQSWCTATNGKKFPGRPGGILN